MAVGWQITLSSPLAVRMLLALILLSGCATPGLPPVAERSPVFGERPATYVVRKGDTLYSIAWRFGLQTKELAAWNSIGAPYLLHIDRRLRLTAPTTVVAKPVPGQQPATVAKTPAAKPSSKPVQVRVEAPSRWQWPVTSDNPLALVSAHYSGEQPGMRFRMPAGNPAKAASGGTVVYAGNGLGGFEHLIILRHARDLLSAYSFNGRRKVAEGATVKVAQPLADIASAGVRGSQLYFELRRKGSPIDPRRIIR